MNPVSEAHDPLSGRVTAFRHAHDRAWARQDEALVDAHGSFHPEPGGIGGSERLIEMAAEVHAGLLGGHSKFDCHNLGFKI